MEETLGNNETAQLGIGDVGTRFFRAAEMFLDDNIPVKVIYKVGDYVHIDKGNEEWTSVHYSRLS